MPVLPTQPAFRLSRLMHQSAMQAQAPGEVTIGGTRYVCAVVLGSVEPKMLEDGINYRNGQDATFSIAKSALATAPTPRAEVTIGTLTFRIVHATGQNDYDQAWHITARRFT